MIRSELNGLRISITPEGFDDLGRQLTLDNLQIVAEFKKIVQRYTELARAEAVKNVSGGVVTYSGGSFVINRQTRKLAGSIQTTYPSPLSGVVIAKAEYAAAIEAGVPYPVDLKPSLMGKTVFIPFRTPYGNRVSPIQFPVQTSSRGGNNPQDPAQTRQVVQSVPLMSSGGRRTGNQFGVFRRVGPNSTGWIIPPRKARPFMGAAAEKIAPLFEADIEKAYVEFVERKGGK